MKILWIEGSDYSASLFAEHCSVEDFAEKLKVGKSQEFEEKILDENFELEGMFRFEATLYDVGDVDTRFIELIRVMQDEDQTKDSNFFIVPEK